MKPKDLRSPFGWKDRHPILQDGVLYIPDHYDQHEDFVMPSWGALFEREQPICIEFCSGNGQWIVRKAEEDPGCNWIAVEMRFDRVRKIWSKARNLGLTNFLVICGDARLAVRHYLPSNSVAAAFVNFPDPWPKKRHAKHRLIQAPFLRELSDIMTSPGELTLVTDDHDYRDQMIAELAASRSFFPQRPDPFYTTDWQGYGDSYFDTLWRSKGRTVHYLPYTS